MKFVFLVLISLFFTGVSAQKPLFDSVRAKQLGADDYGMKQYIMAFLKKGKVNITDSVERAGIFSGHLKNIMRLADAGKLAVAGPFLDDKGLEGVFIFNVKTVEEAKKLTDTDPAVIAGVFEVEFHPWYASAALSEIFKIHGSIQKVNILNN